MFIFRRQSFSASVSTLCSHSSDAQSFSSDTYVPSVSDVTIGNPRSRKSSLTSRLSVDTHIADDKCVAPDSWESDRESEDTVTAGASSGSSQEETLSNWSAVAGVTAKKRIRRKTHCPHTKRAFAATSKFVVRIYRDNGSYHIAQIPPCATVTDLIASLDTKMLHGHERGTHRLYLKERGSERMLAPMERPAAIARRRLEQAGYDRLDGLDYLATENMTYVLKFVYKRQLLGPMADDLSFGNPEYIDLTRYGLSSIPNALQKSAGSVVYLNLSGNPMIKISLDFILSCHTLRELRMSDMAMKKVPQSLQYSVSLRRLDLSCNHIFDLDDAGLDRIPELSVLKLQNNWMEQLPWYFPRLLMLKTLDISNNKFCQLPSVICKVPALRDLDISFNMITELPEDIGRLTGLEQLVFVGNQVSRLPEQCRELVNLQVLDCRRNNIGDLSVTHTLPRLEKLLADHNTIHALDFSHGVRTTILDASFNDITLLKLDSSTQTLFTLTSLDVSHAKLSSLDDFALSHLSTLQTLKLDHNLLRTLPDSLGELHHLVTLSCPNNHLDALPETIGSLRRLETLDVHNNCLRRLPLSLWNCQSLVLLNVTSNLIDAWDDPSCWSPATSPTSAIGPTRKPSNIVTPTSSSQFLPPLAHSLKKLYVAENQLTDDCLSPFMILRELRVLNISFNEIRELSASFLHNLTRLEELYLSGNRLTSIPTQDLPRLTRLSVLFLNGNKLQTLPSELHRVPSLTVIDAGSNALRYNINNWEFDWNWNFNQNLRYLNLSGNKRLEIKPPAARYILDGTGIGCGLADFSRLTSLRVLGLMDVTTTFLPDIPEENADRRVRTSVSDVNRMSYGIADNLGITGFLTMFDLIQPEFRGRQNEAVFAMFGRSDVGQSNNHLSKYLHDNFLQQFSAHLDQIDQSKCGTVQDALRRTFLELNKQLYNTFYSENPSSSFQNSQHAGASGIVLYIVEETVYVANAGDMLAVVSVQGSVELISMKHDPFDHREAERIRMAKGWISPQGLIHGEINTSRGFGYFYRFPVVNARPFVEERELTGQDEFMIIGNRGLWDYISYQTAVDIARSEIADPMIAAQKLRDLAISYGSVGSIMAMVICVADLFHAKKQPTANSSMALAYRARRRKGVKTTDVQNRTIARLDQEVPPPTGHLCIVFADIRNSTRLWETNAGMPAAMRLYSALLCRQLRMCGGYVVRTKGDEFMCTFPTVVAAVWWSLIVQIQLMNEPWPHEILECEEGKEVWDAQGNLIWRGLSVRMGIHCGTPIYDLDPVTHRMNYFGPTVIRTAHISKSAVDGQIMCSGDVVREIEACIMETGSDTEYSGFQPSQAIEAIRQMDIELIPIGKIKLKGLEIPEMVSLIYPESLAGRQEWTDWLVHR